MRISDWGSDVCSSDLPGEFAGAQLRMFARAAIEAPPGDQPDEGGDAGDHERHPPAIGEHQPRHEQRGDDRADIVTGVEDAARQRTLPGREPFGDRLDPGGEIARYADAEADAREPELGARQPPTGPRRGE